MHDGRLGVAIHGAGQVAYAHAASWERCPEATVVSVSSRSVESARRLVETVGLECTIHEHFADVLRDERVDILNISGPNYVHAEQGISAADAGKHLLIEKPMALTIADNRALREAVARNGVKSVVSFVLRWNPLFDNLKSLLAAGAIGTPFYVEVDYWHGIGERYSGWDWARTCETGGSAMLLGGCHAVDAIRWFLQDDVVEVSAFGNNVKHRFEYAANVVATLRFAGGAIGKTSVLLDGEMPYTFNIDLAGPSGTLRDNRLWSTNLLPGQASWSTLPTLMPDSGDVHHHPFDAEVDHLAACILHDTESHCNVADAYHTHEVCLAIDQSLAEGGRPVRLPL